MRRLLPCLALLGSLAAGGEKRLTWEFEGYRSIPEAAAAARARGRRLLLGLSGSGT